MIILKSSPAKSFAPAWFLNGVTFTFRMVPPLHCSFSWLLTYHTQLIRDPVVGKASIWVHSSIPISSLELWIPFATMSPPPSHCSVSAVPLHPGLWACRLEIS
uniref:Uncharacterized protein n=1 Tax=Sphaerodactylus townsendi TaxID=933632 RepID=A0ACB8F128_9SAUR